MIKTVNLVRTCFFTKFFCSVSFTRNINILHFDGGDETVVESLHANGIKDGSLGNSNFRGYLLGLYLKSTDFRSAQKLFAEVPERDVRTWTVLLSGFSRTGSSELVLDLFRRMLMEGVRPNRFTLSNVLKSCSGLGDTKLGKEIHAWIVRNGSDLDVVMENSILDLYVKGGAFDYAERFFELMEERDSVSWNIMLAAYLQTGGVEKSVELFKSCPMRDVSSWNTMIDGLMEIGFVGMALQLIYEMVENGPLFNQVTFSIALVLVSSISVLVVGKQLHARILRLGIHIDGYLKNSLMRMYCKCGEMRKASLIFHKMPLKIVRPENSKMAEAISWSSIVSGYVQNGDYIAALRIFCSMVVEQLEVDCYTLTSIVAACADSGTREFGRQVHAYVHKIGHIVSAHLGSSLIGMYAKHGSLDDARLIFEQANHMNVVLWTSMIHGCALHGHAVEATKLFEQMINVRVKPNEITFVAILTACSHGGLLEEGHKYFRLMREVYSIRPGVEHFTCMVDIYCRAGLLNKAKEFICENNLAHMKAVWKSLLSSCRLHKNTEMGKLATEQLLKLEPFGVGPYLLSSNIWAIENRWEEAAKVRNSMRKRGIKKSPGQSWIETKEEVHSFVIGDRCHPFY